MPFLYKENIKVYSHKVIYLLLFLFFAQNELFWRVCLNYHKIDVLNKLKQYLKGK